MQTSDQMKPEPKKRIFGIFSLLLGVFSLVGSIGALVAFGSFMYANQDVNLESFFLVIIFLVVIIQSVFFLCSIVGIVLGNSALKRESGRGLAIGGIILNAFALFSNCGCIGIGLIIIL